MNRQTITLFILSLLSINATYGNINYIDFNKIDNNEKYLSNFSFVKDNQEYYNHWTPEWNYDKNKDELISKLKDAYSVFSSIPKKNTELYLLTADVAHYLYNLDVTNYNDSAINNFTLAIKNSPDDYRTFWFLAYHYALSNVPNKSIELFLKAQEMKPIDKPSDFWEEYAWATAVTNMPSHAIFAMAKVKSITGKVGNFETQLGQTIYKRIVDVNRDSTYKKEDIWSVAEGEKTTFVCRPLGIKILIDSTWNLSVYDYANHQCAFIINPPTLKNKKGKEIHYTVAILMKVADDTEKLENYLSNFVSKYPNKNKIPFSDKYDKMIAYEINDKTMYQDIGGGHLYMIGIERKMPEYPGMLLESPVMLPEGEKGKVNYYTAADSHNRFKGKIFYAIMLDTCEDIHEQSFVIFKSLFDFQIIVE